MVSVGYPRRPRRRDTLLVDIVKFSVHVLNVT